MAAQKVIFILGFIFIATFQPVYAVYKQVPDKLSCENQIKKEIIIPHNEKNAANLYCKILQNNQRAASNLLIGEFSSNIGDIVISVLPPIEVFPGTGTIIIPSETTIVVAGNTITNSTNVNVNPGGVIIDTTTNTGGDNGTTIGGGATVENGGDTTVGGGANTGGDTGTTVGGGGTVGNGGDVIVGGDVKDEHTGTHVGGGFDRHKYHHHLTIDAGFLKNIITLLSNVKLTFYPFGFGLFSNLNLHALGNRFNSVFFITPSFKIEKNNPHDNKSREVIIDAETSKSLNTSHTQTVVVDSNLNISVAPAGQKVDVKADANKNVGANVNANANTPSVNANANAAGVNAGAGASTGGVNANVGGIKIGIGH